jgi:hypothetical protein
MIVILLMTSFLIKRNPNPTLYNSVDRFLHHRFKDHDMEKAKLLISLSFLL